MIDGMIWVTGSSGLAGSAVVRALLRAGVDPGQVVTVSHHDCDLERPVQVARVIEREKVQAIVHCAGHVGGVTAHLRHPTEYGMRNAQMAVSVLGTALEYRVPNLIYLGSVCIYPRAAPVPTAEYHLMTGSLEPSNMPYAVAKILGIVLCNSIAREYGLNWLSLQPSNLYGPGDRFADPLNAHVVPAIMNKMHWAKMFNDSQVRLPGTGSATREFLHSDDLGDAVVHVLNNVKASEVSDGLLNVGSGMAHSIGNLAVMIAGAVGYTGGIVYDQTHSDGAHVRVSDCSRIRATGWLPKRVMSVESLREIYESVGQWGRFGA